MTLHFNDQKEFDQHMRENPDLSIDNETLGTKGHNPYSKTAVRLKTRHPDLSVDKLLNKSAPERATEGIKPQTGGKYHIAPKEDRIYNEVLYASKKEAQFATTLDLRVKAGYLDFWLRQVPFQLTDCIYRLDFMTFHYSLDEEWIVSFIEVKGFKTRLGELKRKQCESLYQIHIEVV